MFGRLKRVFGPTEGTDRPYECRQCGTRFGVQYHVCPECGAFAVEREYTDPEATGT